MRAQNVSYILKGHRASANFFTSTDRASLEGKGKAVEICRRASDPQSQHGELNTAPACPAILEEDEDLTPTGESFCFGPRSAEGV